VSRYVVCRLCGRDPFTVRGWLERVNPKGEAPIMECRPACYPLLTNGQAVIGAVSGDTPPKAGA